MVKNLIRDVQQGGIVELIGPMKVVMVNPTSAANRRKCFWAGFCNFCTILSHILISLTVGLTLAYTLKNVGEIKMLNSYQLHIIFFTLGYQFFISEAILCFNNFNGWSALLSVAMKKIIHTMLVLLATICISFGTAVVLLIDIKGSTNMFDSKTLHGVTGFVAVTLTAISLVNGVCAFYAFELGFNKVWQKFHAFFGVIAYVMSSISFMSGLMLQSQGVRAISARNLTERTPQSSSNNIWSIFKIARTNVTSQRILDKIPGINRGINTGINAGISNINSILGMFTKPTTTTTTQSPIAVGPEFETLLSDVGTKPMSYILLSSVLIYTLVVTTLPLLRIFRWW